MNEEASVNKQPNVIVDGFTSRISSGAIPVVDYFQSDSTKMSQAAQVETDKGLKMRVYADKKMGAGTIENVTLLVDDYGKDTDLQELIEEKNFGTAVRGIEVSLHDELRPDNVGMGKLIDSPEGSGSGTHASTHAYVSPEVTQALMERIPLKSS